MISFLLRECVCLRRDGFINPMLRVSMTNVCGRCLGISWVWENTLRYENAGAFLSTAIRSAGEEDSRGSRKLILLLEFVSPKGLFSSAPKDRPITFAVAICGPSNRMRHAQGLYSKVFGL